MAAKKVGTLIKEARTAAGLTQDQLAKKAGLTAADISKAERGEKSLTDAQLKAIAKATGVTQKSLLEAPKGGTSATSGKKPATDAKASASSAMKLSAEEKKLITLYRSADEKTKKAVIEFFNEGAEETGSILSGLLGGSASSGIGGFLGSLLGGSSNNSQSSGSGGLIGSLLGGNQQSSQNQSSGSGGLIGSLLGGGNSGNGNSGNLLGSLIGGVLGGKREMPEGEGEEPENGEGK